tara:strand:+ start:849 stop:1400 length:552 start_codon:yes stop_codon:yes gene_type:complete
MTTKQKLDIFITKNHKWLERNIKKNIAKGKMSDYADELLQEMIIQVYGMKEEKVDELIENGKLKWYILSGAGMQLRSSTSPFYNRVRKHKMYAREVGLPGSDKNIFERADDTEAPSTECYFSCMQREIENLHWYNKTLLKEYWIDGLHLDQLHAKYKISKKHLTNDLNSAILTIRENCKECDQ